MANRLLKTNVPFHWRTIHLSVWLLLLPFCVMNASANGVVPRSHGDKPGFHKLDRSNNNEICGAIGTIINSEQQNLPQASRDGELRFARWEISQNLDRGDVDGPVVETELDINNDGAMDKVVKVRWSIGGSLTDTLYVHPAAAAADGAHALPLRRLIAEAKAISFIESRDSIERLKKRYGNAWQAWFFDGIAVIDPFTYKNQTYVFAQNVSSSTDVSLKTYVFQLDRSHRVMDVCMFHRVCSCQGCQDLRGEELAKASPSARWCKKR